MTLVIYIFKIGINDRDSCDGQRDSRDIERINFKYIKVKTDGGFPNCGWDSCQHGAEEWCGWEVEVGCQIVVHGITQLLELGVSEAIKDHLRLKRLNDVFSFLFEVFPKRR